MQNNTPKFAIIDTAEYSRHINAQNYCRLFSGFALLSGFTLFSGFVLFSRFAS